jgi:hypothetical protein
VEPFATVADYRRAYPDDAIDDGTLLERLLEATDVMCAEMDGSDISYTDPSESFTFRLMRVCRTVAHRAIASTDGSDVPFGATQLSETATQFSASMQFANPTGDMYLTESERRALGIGAGRACVLSPYA